MPRAGAGRRAALPSGQRSGRRAPERPHGLAPARQSAARVRAAAAVQRPRPDRSRRLRDQPDDQDARPHPARPHVEQDRHRRAVDRGEAPLRRRGLRALLLLAAAVPADLQRRRLHHAAGHAHRGVRRDVEGGPVAAVAEVPVRIRLGLGHERPGDAARPHRLGADQVPVQVLRRRRHVQPRAVGPEGLRLQQGRPRELRHVRGLAAAAPVGWRAPDDERHVPGRGGVPRRMGARLRSPGRELPPGA